MKNSFWQSAFNVICFLVIVFLAFTCYAKLRTVFVAPSPREKATVTSGARYSFPVLENEVWSTTAKFVAHNEAVVTEINNAVLSPPFESVSLDKGEMKVYENFGDTQSLSSGGYGYFVFDGTASESRADYYYFDGTKRTAFTIPAIAQFANAKDERGEALGLYSNVEKQTWITLWGEPRNASIEVYDDKNVLLATEEVKADDYIEGKFTHYQLSTLCVSLCRIEVYSTDEVTGPFWGIAVTGFPDGSSQDVVPIRSK